MVCVSGGLIRVKHLILGPSFGAFKQKKQKKKEMRVLISPRLSSAASNGTTAEWTLIKSTSAEVVPLCVCVF
jgi:hypothetical protein